MTAPTSVRLCCWALSAPLTWYDVSAAHAVLAETPSINDTANSGSPAANGKLAPTQGLFGSVRPRDRLHAGFTGWLHSMVEIDALHITKWR